MGHNAAKIAGIRLVLDSCEPGLQGAPHCLHSRWSASHYGSLRTLHAHMCPIRVSRTLDRMPLRKSCLSAGEQLSFIRRIASENRAASASACKSLKTSRKKVQKSCDTLSGQSGKAQGAFFFSLNSDT